MPSPQTPLVPSGQITPILSYQIPSFPLVTFIPLVSHKPTSSLNLPLISRTHFPRFPASHTLRLPESHDNHRETHPTKTPLYSAHTPPLIFPDATVVETSPIPPLNLHTTLHRIGSISVPNP
ncbi:uncharacterized protein CANTADRAFT_232760 [Suhomyces tanzawaensis NRRL Y-17324]|uniref:Uncharacterized protein n=1 Tax=Suhomyces tanzawaensis NRRL Y-17324 TaxID=984487 RepID=A0A1E4SLE8_9ASCO|nr:uncharacterized protein CANTADRAFT_232760 [Suhomyces tanzawaensis NRRL Y-17324]ODV80318.1 hypothetical protein CANTADRAFT_232760 [Suhomyces tanzawaensis NRRL Y-17324]